MDTLSDSALLAYMRSHKLAVVSTLGAEGHPQSALVGVGIADDFGVIFDTVSTSRKHANLLRDPRAAVTFSGPAEQTLQFEGTATSVSKTDPRDARHREDYYRAWPDGRDRAVSWPSLVYWRIAPRWLRFSDYDRGPMIFERHFRGDAS
jgi:pyridoxine/pyridoxamine 5'-phosphate oxidase